MKRKTKQHRVLHGIGIMFGFFLLFAGVCLWYVFSFNPEFDRALLHVTGEGDFHVVWFPSESSDTVTIVLPADAVVAQEQMFNQYTLSSLWRFSRQPGSDRIILHKIVSRMLQIPVKDVIHDGEKSSVLAFPFPQTSLSYREFIYYYFRLKKESLTGNTTRYDISTDEYVVNMILPDGQRVQAINTDVVSRRLKHVFESQKLKEEALRISLLNSTGISGRAEKAADYFSRVGLFISQTGNVVGKYEPCSFSAKDSLEESYTARYLKTQYSCTFIPKSSDGPYDIELNIGTTLFPFGG